MASSHGVRQQKRAAKLKARRSAKRAVLLQRTSPDPTIRLRTAAKWPVIKAIVSCNLWNSGLGYLCIARENPQGEIAFAIFLVDVFCMGVKDAFWHIGTRAKLDEIVDKLESSQPLTSIAPACLVKIVRESVAYAQSFGLPPHPDYARTTLILEGIDPALCPENLEFGHGGRPLYIQGPHESPVAAAAVAAAIQKAGGEFMMGNSLADLRSLPVGGNNLYELDSPESDDLTDDDD
jgi:hypothetical protein